MSSSGYFEKHRKETCLPQVQDFCTRHWFSPPCTGCAEKSHRTRKAAWTEHARGNWFCSLSDRCLGGSISADFLPHGEQVILVRWSSWGRGKGGGRLGHISPGAAADPTECSLCWITKRLSLWAKITRGMAGADPRGNRIRTAWH